MTQLELKPCPFCGAEMERCDDSPIYGQTMMHPSGCDCFVSGNMFYHSDLIRLWNKRIEIKDAD